MGAKEAEKPFLEKMTEYLLSLPFDLKVLQEAVTEPDLDRKAREMAAGTIIHTLLPQDGELPYRYCDDVLLVRAALHHVTADGSEGAKAFRARFDEIYGRLDDDLQVFDQALGDLWPWLNSKLESFGKLTVKGVKPSECVDDEEASTMLYEEGLEFQTNYPVNENQVKNKIRKIDTILEFLNKRRAEEAKKKV
jgi:hypothetical protein